MQQQSLDYETRSLGPRGEAMSKAQGLALIVSGCVVSALVGVLQYTLFEYEWAWLALGAFGVAAIALGLNGVSSRVLATLVGAVLLAGGSYGMGFVIAFSVGGLFEWSAR